MLLETEYKVDDEEIKEYFPLDVVTQGHFRCLSGYIRIKV